MMNGSPDGSLLTTKTVAAAMAQLDATHIVTETAATLAMETEDLAGRCRRMAAKGTVSLQKVTVLHGGSQ